MARPSHQHFMRRAMELALQGKGKTSPNPIVGAVLVRKGRILAEGFHRKAGGDHAEIVALKKLAKDQARGATLYVTMEPCCLYGKTPPCVPRIVDAGIRHVVIGARDPNPEINGKGIQWLKEAGVEINEGVLHEDCENLNRPFQKFITTRMPYVTLKVALSLDGKIATAERESKWITNALARAYVHELRSEVDAVLIGGGTLRYDDPLLTVRHGNSKNGRQPMVVVLDRTLDIPPERNLFIKQNRPLVFATTWTSPEEKRRMLIKMGAEVWPFDADLTGRVDLKALLKTLAQKNVMHLLVEGGGEVFSSFIGQRLADHVVICMAPKLLGGQSMDWLPELSIRKMEEAYQLKNLSLRQLEDNVVIEGELAK
ncbi:MAG: bifunctional diaminohydroxyphosphoribosylaminopyrimidine deaminase/5-amino-6-(5-phosphoribosylamino)uracil reductase RibD [Deltaproteobacteria bacterium]|nr:bifunctional diaminohydroxyphosphoribosylaminopyrimidine deaminase/5-amino-6-(5-phosphoribosylamino)uracil reductase RibD [Deltaproteobacteria bacterium]